MFAVSCSEMAFSFVIASFVPEGKVAFRIASIFGIDHSAGKRKGA
jgi:hypothetical protein